MDEHGETPIFPWNNHLKIHGCFVHQVVGLVLHTTRPQTNMTIEEQPFEDVSLIEKQQFEDISPTNNGCFPFVILVFRGLIPLIIKATVKISWDSSNDSRTTYRVTELVEEVTPAVQFTVSLPPSWVLREWNCFSLRTKSLPLKKKPSPPQKRKVVSKPIVFEGLTVISPEGKASWP